MIAPALLALALVGLADDPPPDPLPVVVLVGDSIRLGYAPVVVEALRGKAEVFSPEANGGDSANVLRHLDAWVLSRRPAVVHLNAGLHDLKRDRATRAHQVELDAYRASSSAPLARPSFHRFEDYGRLTFEGPDK